MKRVLRLSMFFLGLFATSSLAAMEPILRFTLGDHAGSVWSVAFSPDGKSLIGSWGGTLAMWDVRTGKNTVDFDANSTVMSVTFGQDGRTAASVTHCGGVIELWDVAAGKNNAKRSVVGAEEDEWFAVVGAQNSSLAFSPDGKTLAATGSDQEAVKMWDLATGKLLATMKHRGTDFPVAYAPDGKTLATGCRPSAIVLWDLSKQTTTLTFNGHTGDVTSVAFSPDGKTLVSASKDKTVKAWDVATGKNIATFHGHTDVVNSVAFSADGKTLASGSADKTIRLWDLSSGKSIAKLEGHKECVLCVAFSPDGKILASGSDDQTVKLWDVKRHRIEEPNSIQTPERRRVRPICMPRHARVR